MHATNHRRFLKELPYKLKMSFKVLQQGLFYFLKENANALFSPERYDLTSLVSLMHLRQTCIAEDIHVPVHGPKSSTLLPEREKCTVLGGLDSPQNPSQAALSTCHQDP